MTVPFPRMAREQQLSSVSRRASYARLFCAFSHFSRLFHLFDSVSLPNVEKENSVTISLSRAGAFLLLLNIIRKVFLCLLPSSTLVSLRLLWGRGTKKSPRPWPGLLDTCFRLRVLSTRPFALVLLPAFVICSSGCASYERMPAPAYVPDDIENKQESKIPPLKAAVLPLQTKDQNMMYFAKNLRDENLLPLVVAIENGGKRGYRLHIKDVEFVGPDGKQISPVPVDELYKEYFKKSVTSRAVGGFFGGAAIAAATFLILSPAIIVMPILCAINTKDVNQTIQNDLNRITFTNEVTADPNLGVQAVIFFKYSKKKDLKGAEMRLNNIHSLNAQDPPASFSFKFT